MGCSVQRARRASRACSRHARGQAHELPRQPVAAAETRSLLVGAGAPLAGTEFADAAKAESPLVLTNRHPDDRPSGDPAILHQEMPPTTVITEAAIERLTSIVTSAPVENRGPRWMSRRSYVESRTCGRQLTTLIEGLKMRMSPQVSAPDGSG